MWQDLDYGSESIPVSGFAYYISPPQNFGDVAKDPIHLIVYTIFILGSCAFFSKIWIEISGESTKD